jgi:hypothetical protein
MLRLSSSELTSEARAERYTEELLQAEDCVENERNDKVRALHDARAMRVLLEQWRERAEELEKERLIREQQLAVLTSAKAAGQVSSSSDASPRIGTPHFERSPADTPSPERHNEADVEVHKEARVWANETFTSDSRGNLQISKGVSGVVHAVDGDGNVSIKFSGHDEPQTIRKDRLYLLEAQGMPLASVPSMVEEVTAVCAEQSELRKEFSTYKAKKKTPQI